MVVVAEANLGDADRVVLVDDRQYIPFKTGDNGIASIQVTAAVIEIAGRKQDLRRLGPIGVKALLISSHQKPLPHCRAGLQMPQIARPLGETKSPYSCPDGPRAYKDDFPAQFADTLHLIGEALDSLLRQQAIRSRQHVGANLDHDRVGQGNNFLTNRIEHGDSGQWSEKQEVHTWQTTGFHCPDH